MRTSHFTVLAWALLAGGWVAACGSDDPVLIAPVADGGPVEATVTGCNSIAHAGCSYDDVGCDPNVVSFRATLEDPDNLCMITVEVQCADGCVESATVLPDGTPVVGDDAGDMTQATTLPFGDPCESDTDCAEGLTCLASDGTGWFGGGPSNGYCTVSCAADPEVCSQYTGTVCVSGGPGEAFCFDTCLRGQVAKCDDRRDVACFQVGATVAACLPTCGSDNQCPDGRFCDIVAGVCVDDEPQGDPIGTPCELGGENTCEGFCDNFGTVDEPFGLCTGYCTVGLDAPGCGVDPADPVTPGDPFCFPLLGADDFAGDTGLCVQRCDCKDNCNDPEAQCSPWLSADDAALARSAGVCIRGAADADAGLMCGAADDDAGTNPVTPDAAVPNIPGPDAGNNPSTPDASSPTVDAGDAG